MFVTTDDGIRLQVIAGTRDGVPLVLSNSLGADAGYGVRKPMRRTESFCVALRHARARPVGRPGSRVLAQSSRQGLAP